MYRKGLLTNKTIAVYAQNGIFCLFNVIFVLLAMQPDKCKT